MEVGTATEAFINNGSGNTDDDYYEFTPILLVNDNAAITSISAPVAPLATGVQNVDVVLENAGLNTLTSATINWSINGTVQTANSWTGSLAPNATATVNLGTYNFLAGNSTISAWSTLPNGLADGDSSNDSIGVTLCTSLSGTYTVGGTSPDYTDIASAVADLNSCGISGPVTFDIAAGTYTGSAVIGDVVGSSATNRISFNVASAATTTMTYDGSGTLRGVMTLDGTDYVTLKNMTIEHTGTSNAYGVHLTNTADFNTIDSCIVKVDNSLTTSTLIPILVSGTLTGTGTAGNNANNTMISNCTTIGGYYGIRIYGNSSATPDNSNNTVSNCNITDAYYYGIYFYYQDSPVADGNTVNLTRNTSSGYALYMNYAKHPQMTKNTLNGARTYGIYLSQANTTTQGSNQRGLIANNMISSLGLGEGIYLSAADSIDIWHNSVSAENENALWLSSTANEYNVRNNIFVTLNGPEVIELDVAPGATDVIDYNTYFHSGAGVLVDIVGTDYADIAAWTAFDPVNNANSVYGDPVFFGPTNLHASSTVPNNVAVIIASITDDIDGDVRSATTPDIGADEFTPPTCLLSSAGNVTNLTFSSADLGWTAGGSETNWDVQWGAAGFTLGSGTIIANTSSNPVSVSTLMAVSSYDFYVRGICGPSDTAAWAGPFNFTTPCGNYTPSYSEDFTTFVPQCWEEFQGVLGAVTTTITNATTSNWTSTNFGNTGSNSAARINLYSTGRDEWIMSPSIDLGTGTIAYQLSFDVALTNYNSTAATTFGVDDTLAVVISTDNGATWNQANILQMWGAGSEPSNTGDFVAIDLSSYTGVVKFGFYAASSVSNADNDIFIDNFLVDLLPSCPQPAGLSTSNLTATSVDINWTVGAANSNVEYGVAGFTQGTGTIIAATGGMASITGLTANTTYNFYVQDSCGAAAQSAWTGPISVYTGHCIPAPSSVDASGITNVTLGTINNTTGAEQGNYGDYSAQVADVIQGAPAQAFDITLSTGYTYGTQIWVDWNNDLVFDASEIVYYGLSGSANPSTLSGTFAIPATAALGSYRLRIGGTDNDLGPNDPCYTGSYGSFEDYTINVIAPCQVMASDVQVACDTYTWIDGMTYTADNNTAIDTVLSNVAGVCDTIYTLDLTINSSTTGTDVQAACDTYTWIDGMTYTASNTTATHVLTNAAGCDSTVTLDLTINNSATGTDVQVACDTYTWIDGVTYTSSNVTAMYTIASGAANGCDSIVTLDLTINNSNTGLAVVSACGSYTWIDGITYTSSTTAMQTLTNAAGCDSVVTLLLTINQPSAGTSTITACGSYTWIDGMTYTASNNNATYTLNNSNGCDSVVTLDLTINNVVTNTITVSECDSYTSDAGNTYTSTGMYTEMFTAANGCDSVLTLDVTITNPSNSVSLSNNIFLTSNQAGATYQWLDCGNGNAPIAGATDQVYVASANGDYACEVTLGSCTVTSTCITVSTVGIEGTDVTFASVYPNPVNNLLTITLSDLDNAQFELLDMQGKIVMAPANIVSGQTINVSQLESGVYFVRLTSDNHTMIKRVVKN